MGEDIKLVCSLCRTVHHELCWKTNHKCSVFGCRGKKNYLYGKSKSSSRVKVRRGGDNKIGRNDSCPCGSSRKYKDCCLTKVKTGITQPRLARQ
ncbi:SEC-C domain-containing protein [bacterium]|nr:SEC-C domain-containing protein [bacterium]